MTLQDERTRGLRWKTLSTGVAASAVVSLALATGCSSSSPESNADLGDGSASTAVADGAQAGSGGAQENGADSGGSRSSLDAKGPTNGGTTGDVSAGCASGPQTPLHYAAGWSGDSPGSTLGFNLADVSSAGAASALPAGFQALVWLGTCNGADASFVSTVQPFIGNSRVYAFYLMDEPDPTGMYAPPACPAANLKAESDWIHAHVPGTKTFVVMMNLGSDRAPSYDGSYNPANTGIDLYGLDPYPCRSTNNACDYAEIAASVAAAKTWGISEVSIVPVYQAFGGGGYASWTLPTAAQEQTILTAWASATPRPAFDYVYAWGSQQGDTAASQTPDLQAVFAAHNASTCTPGGD
jgi:hypothetical protein